MSFSPHIRALVYLQALGACQCTMSVCAHQEGEGAVRRSERATPGTPTIGYLSRPGVPTIRATALRCASGAIRTRGPTAEVSGRGRDYPSENDQRNKMTKGKERTVGAETRLPKRPGRRVDKATLASWKEVGSQQEARLRRYHSSEVWPSMRKQITSRNRSL